MVFYLFSGCLLVSTIILLYMASKSYNNIDTYFWGIILMIPIIILGYTLKSRANCVDDAKTAFCILYLDSTVLLVMVYFSMLKMLGIQLKFWVKLSVYAVSFLHLASIWLCKNNTLYYATFEIEKTPLGTVTRMTDGPLKITHYIYLIAMFCAIVITLIVCAIRKKDCSKKSITIYASIMLAGLVIYAIEMFTHIRFSLLPYLYVIGDLIIVIQYESIHSHDMDCVIAEQKSDHSNRGYVAFDKKKNLLGYNDYAVNYVQELKGRRIDASFDDCERLVEVFYPLIDQFEQEKKASRDFTVDSLIFRCRVSN